VACIGLLVATAWAAEEKVEGRVYKSPDLVGKTVKNMNGDTLGVIEDFVIDVKTGRTAYAVLAHGETLGFGGKLFAIDPAALHMSDDIKFLQLDAPLSDFASAQGFDANKWPTEADQRWRKKGGKEEGRTEAPAKEDRKADANKGEHRELARLSSITGMVVRSTGGQDLGRVQGVAIDLENRRVVYAALAYGGTLGVGTKYFAIPWQALECKSPDLKPTNKVLVLDVEKQVFDTNTGFDKNLWPLKADDRFGKKKGT
jgi:sporulation protein YlmC with PRC-barrel domain